MVNVDEVKEYMRRVGIMNTNYTPGNITKTPSISKLAQLDAEPVVEENLQVA